MRYIEDGIYAEPKAPSRYAFNNREHTVKACVADPSLFSTYLAAGIDILCTGGNSSTGLATILTSLHSSL